MDAREIESLSMLSRGFQELRDVNAELSYNVILDILAGLNEYVWKNPVHVPFFFLPFFFSFNQLAHCHRQECCSAATRANLTRTLPTPKSHTKERDDKSRSRGDGGGRGHCRPIWWSGCPPHDHPWRWRRRRHLTCKAVTDRRTSLHAVARRTQNQMAEYTVMMPMRQARSWLHPLPPYLFFLT